MFELFEIAGYLIGFWLFIFSKKFRKVLIAEYRQGGFIGKTFIIFQAITSTIVSVLLPAGLFYYAYIE